jgi:hypothetical protein
MNNTLDELLKNINELIKRNSAFFEQNPELFNAVEDRIHGAVLEEDTLEKAKKERRKHEGLHEYSSDELEGMKPFMDKGFSEIEAFELSKGFYHGLDKRSKGYKRPSGKGQDQTSFILSKELDPAEPSEALLNALKEHMPSFLRPFDKDIDPEIAPIRATSAGLSNDSLKRFKSDAENHRKNLETSGASEDEIEDAMHDFKKQWHSNPENMQGVIGDAQKNTKLHQENHDKYHNRLKEELSAILGADVVDPDLDTTSGQEAIQDIGGYSDEDEGSYGVKQFSTPQQQFASDPRNKQYIDKLKQEHQPKQQAEPAAIKAPETSAAEMPTSTQDDSAAAAAPKKSIDQHLSPEQNTRLQHVKTVIRRKGVK